MTAVRKLMSADDFLTWCLDQEGKWELVAGEPILMMTGATHAHDRVVVNVILALGARLRGGPCRPTTDDIAARIPNGNVRRPDVTVDCGSGDERAMESFAPVLFVEVLSVSTRAFDLVRKPEDYKLVPTLRHLLMIDPRSPRAWLLSRTQADEPWTSQDVEGLEAAVALDALGLSLPMAEIYADVRFPPPA